MDRPRRRRIRIADALATAAVVALLACLLLPTFQRARPSARKTICESNLRAIVRGLQQYRTDRGAMPGYLVPVDNPGDPSQLAAAMEYPRQVLAPYVDASAWECPGASRRARRLGVSYVYPGFGGNGWQEPKVYGYENVPAAWDNSAEHFGRAQVAYLDGHVAPHDPEGIIAFPAAAKWLNTHIPVHKDDVLRIAAAGQAHNGPNAGPTNLFPPTGNDDTAPDDAIARTWPNGGLLGRVDGNLFFIGHAGELRPGAEGLLQVALNENDGEGESADNQGSWWVLASASPSSGEQVRSPTQEPFDDLGGWSLTPVAPGRATVKDGVLHILHEPGNGIHLRQRDPLPPSELDITLRVMVRTSEEHGPEYDLEGGTLMVGTGGDQAPPWQTPPEAGGAFYALVAFRERARVNDRRIHCFNAGMATPPVPLDWSLQWDEWYTVRVEIRRTWVRIVADGAVLGSAPLDGRSAASRYIWLSCASADVLIDHLDRMPVSPATRAPS